MTILAIIVAVLLVVVAFKFIKGMIKLAALAIVVLLGLFIAHRVGAF